MSAEQTVQRLGWTLQTVESTGSTNADLVGRDGDGLVLVAHEQTAGRGRLERHWVSEPGDGLTFSVRLRVPSTVRQWGWISLLAGVATADAVRAGGAQGVGVKWPNDVLAGGGKVAGILSQVDRDCVIIGIGLNVAFAGPRPDPKAVSVEQAGGNPDADALLSAILTNLHTWWARLVESGGDARRSGLAEAYTSQCVTIGADVVVETPDGSVRGVAESIDDQGRLLVSDGAEVVAVGAGDVTLSG